MKKVLALLAFGVWTVLLFLFSLSIAAAFLALFALACFVGVTVYVIDLLRYGKSISINPYDWLEVIHSDEWKTGKKLLSDMEKNKKEIERKGGSPTRVSLGAMFAHLSMLESEGYIISRLSEEGFPRSLREWKLSDSGRGKRDKASSEDSTQRDQGLEGVLVGA